MGTLSAQYLSFQGWAAFPINQVAGLIPGARYKLRAGATYRALPPVVS